VREAVPNEERRGWAYIFVPTGIDRMTARYFASSGQSNVEELATGSAMRAIVLPICTRRAWMSSSNARPTVSPRSQRTNVDSACRTELNTSIPMGPSAV